MVERFNPLFDSAPNKRSVSATLYEVEAGVIPKSPINGKAMQQVFCGETATFVDMENRIVLPVRDQA